MKMNHYGRHDNSKKDGFTFDMGTVGIDARCFERFFNDNKTSD